MILRDWIVPIVAAWFGIAALAFDVPYLWMPAALMFVPWLLLRLWGLRAAAKRG